MNTVRWTAAALLTFAGAASAWAGGISIGAPRTLGISPGLSQRCLQKLDVKAQGAAAARAVHECRKPVSAQPPPGDKPAAAPIKQQ